MKCIFIISFTAFLFTHYLATAQFSPALPRHAYWGATFADPTESRAGAVVQSIKPATFAEQAGLKVNDIVLKINNYHLTDLKTFEQCRLEIKGGTKVEMLVRRNNQLITLSGTVPEKPRETNPGIITEYKSVLTDMGYKVQVIITRPENTSGKIPGIFVVRWLSCDPIEKPVSRKHGVNMLLDDLIQKSGYALIRVEKTGFGDSEGMPCSDADFNHELAAHRAAFKAFRELDFIDSNKVFVFAQSNGAAYAPLVTGNKKVAGYAVTGLWAKTWYEHMMEFERKRFSLMKLSPQEVTRRMPLVAEFYTDYLIKKQFPVDILNAKPHLKDIWDDEDKRQYGITAAYYHQLQQLNIAEAWSKVNVPVYIAFGDYDFLMSRDDHEKIAELVNKNKPGLASFELLPQMNHSVFWFNAIQDGFDDFYGKGTYKDILAQKIMSWMKQMNN
jgi:uncharacterized protein